MQISSPLQNHFASTMIIIILILMNKLCTASTYMAMWLITRPMPHACAKPRSLTACTAFGSHAKTDRFLFGPLSQRRVTVSIQTVGARNEGKMMSCIYSRPCTLSIVRLLFTSSTIQFNYISFFHSTRAITDY